MEMQLALEQAAALLQRTNGLEPAAALAAAVSAAALLARWTHSLNPKLHWMLGVALQKQEKGEDGRAALEKAVAAYERALELQPRLQPARLNLVRALLALGRNAEAERHANDAVAREPGSPERLVALACAQAAQGRLADAAAVLRKALALDSNCATALRAARLLEQRLAAGAGGGAGAALAGAQGHAGEPGKEE